LLGGPKFLDVTHLWLHSACNTRDRHSITLERLHKAQVCPHCTRDTELDNEITNRTPRLTQYHEVGHRTNSGLVGLRYVITTPRRVFSPRTTESATARACGRSARLQESIAILSGNKPQHSTRHVHAERFSWPVTFSSESMPSNHHFNHVTRDYTQLSNATKNIQGTTQSFHFMDFSRPAQTSIHLRRYARTRLPITYAARAINAKIKRVRFVFSEGE